MRMPRYFLSLRVYRRPGLQQKPAFIHLFMYLLRQLWGSGWWQGPDGLMVKGKGYHGNDQVTS